MLIEDFVLQNKEAIAAKAAAAQGDDVTLVQHAAEWDGYTVSYMQHGNQPSSPFHMTFTGCVSAAKVYDRLNEYE